MKFCGKIGFAEFYESSPSVWEERIKEGTYYGDVISNSRINQSGGELLDDISINNRISVIADSGLIKVMGFIRYVEWIGVRWKVKDISAEYPRLILSIGGIYNGPGPETQQPTGI